MTVAQASIKNPTMCRNVLATHECVQASTHEKNRMPTDPRSKRSIIQSFFEKIKTSYAQRLLKSKQYTIPHEKESNKLVPANHMDTPYTGEPLGPQKTLEHRVGSHRRQWRAHQEGNTNVTGPCSLPHS